MNEYCCFYSFSYDKTSTHFILPSSAIISFTTSNLAVTGNMTPATMQPFSFDDFLDYQN